MLGVLGLVLSTSCGAAAQAFPPEALGFRFGSPPEDACVGAGGEWHMPLAYAGSCSVVLGPTGHDGYTAVETCDGEACSVMFQTTAGTAAGAAAWADLLEMLTRHYGAGEVADRGPAVCSSAVRATPSEDTAACLASLEDAGLVQRWTLEGGTIALQFAPARDAVEVTLSYTSEQWMTRSVSPR